MHIPLHPPDTFFQLRRRIHHHHNRTSSRTSAAMSTVSDSCCRYNVTIGLLATTIWGRFNLPSSTHSVIFCRFLCASSYIGGCILQQLQWLNLQLVSTKVIVQRCSYAPWYCAILIVLIHAQYRCNISVNVMF